MLQLPIIQIDAFTAQCFAGNPAAIIPLDNWLDDAQLLAIAAENNLSETAFLRRLDKTEFELRWFTPEAEVELCGHATLASAWWLFHQAPHDAEVINFATRSGRLEARRVGSEVEIKLPARPTQEAPTELPRINTALDRSADSLRVGANYLAVFATQTDIAELQPDFAKLKDLHPYGLIVTAPGDSCDIVSRYFAPSYGINEDPVTGSAHCDLAPYWCARLGKTELHARQLSTRGGEIHLRLEGDSVYLRGACALYMQGQIYLP